MVAAETSKLEADRKEIMKERLRPLPSAAGLDDEQLKQLCRELHAAIDKVDIVFI
jgi:hypothetical protein